MIRETTPLIVALLMLSGTGAQIHPATMTLMDVWEAAECGSTQNFLLHLETDTAAGLLDMCDMYLQDLRSLSELELTLLFAVMGIEASPSDVTNWDSRKVLETILSAPNHTYYFSNTVLQIDSLLDGDSIAVVFFTLHDPYGHSNSVQLPALMTDRGWKLAGLDTMMTSAIEDSFYY